MSDDAAECAIKALIDAEPMILADATLHADAVRRAIAGSGLPLAAQMAMRARMDRKGGRQPN